MVIADRKRKDYYEILSEYGKMTCIEVAKKYNISHSMVCYIWRQNGKRDKRRS